MTEPEDGGRGHGPVSRGPSPATCWDLMGERRLPRPGGVLQGRGGLHRARRPSGVVIPVDTREGCGRVRQRDAFRSLACARLRQVRIHTSSRIAGCSTRCCGRPVGSLMHVTDGSMPRLRYSVAKILAETRPAAASHILAQAVRMHRSPRPSVHPAAGQDGAADLRPVIAAGILVDPWRPAELAPRYDRHVVQQAANFQVVDQGAQARGRACRRGRGQARSSCRGCPTGHVGQRHAPRAPASTSSTRAISEWSLTVGAPSYWNLYGLPSP